MIFIHDGRRGSGQRRDAQSEMGIILVLAVVVIIAVLLVSTKAYLEIPVLLLTFGVAAILNMGTNYWFGEISFVTNSIAVVLQLAADRLCHYFLRSVSWRSMCS